MNIVYKPFDDVAMRKEITKRLGMCPVDLEVAQMRETWQADVDLPGGQHEDLYMLHGPRTVMITFAPIQSEPPYVFHFDFVPEDG